MRCTIGWIAAGWTLSGWMAWSGRPIGDCLNIGGGFAILCGIYSFTLPHTPPNREAKEAFAIGKVLGMLKDPSFAVFSAVAFILLIFASFYYFMAPTFLPTLGVSWHNNHHAFPSSAVHGLRWWQLDVNYLSICMLERFGLVDEVKRAPLVPRAAHPETRPDLPAQNRK